MNPEPSAPNYHALLIGIDRYPKRYRSLSGCVNDIDAIEELLLNPPGIGIPPDCIHITRLAADGPNRTPKSRLQAETLQPTRANVIAALRKLAGEEVGPNDRVLIYYSGHGDEKQWTGGGVWHESLVPHNDIELERLFDIEINSLIGAIAARTPDLTVIFDCCHSAGATRGLDDEEPQGDVRSLESDDVPVPAPDLAALALDTSVGERSLGGPMLQSTDPSYLVVAACQPDETAKEGAKNDTRHGTFTYSLLKIMEARDAEQRAAVRWADIWPDLLDRVEARNMVLNQGAQHPWLIGRAERKVFGGPWEKADAGYRITQKGDAYEVAAGELMGVTEGAEIAVYGPEPLLFPAIGSPEDRPISRLKITKAGRSTATAALIGPEFKLEGARGRLVKPGDSQRLRVILQPADPALEARLGESALLESVDPAHPGAEVRVTAGPDGWTIGNEVEPLVAFVPSGEFDVLKAGLEHYYAYNATLRMAASCADPQLAGRLTVQLLDCNDDASIEDTSDEALAKLPEAPRDRDRVYALPENFQFCIRVQNSSTYHLFLTLFDATSGGLVDRLCDVEVRDGDTQYLWFGSDIGSRFAASPDLAPHEAAGAPLPDYVTDRIVVIGTTRPDADLNSLVVGQTVQQVVAEAMSRGDRGMRPVSPAGPAELWTASVVRVRMMRA